VTGDRRKSPGRRRDDRNEVVEPSPPVPFAVDPPTNRTRFREDRLLTIKEAAVVLGRSDSWLYKNYETERVPYVRKPGNGLGFRLPDLRAWLERHLQNGR
jgi:predicted DNA-binding transcriptional regulator AlpA